MPGGELEPVSRSAPALAEVAAEMSAIFAQAGADQPVPGLRRPAAVSALRPSRGGGPTATVLTAAAAGLLGLGAGAFVVRSPGTAAPAAAKVAIQVPAKAPLQPQIVPQASTPPPIALAQAAPAPAAEAAAKPVHAGKSSAESTKAAAARSRARFRMKLARLGADEDDDPDARPPLRLGVPSMPAARPASCELNADSDDCHRAVVQADRHLRSVYESAFRRGVSRDVLVDYRDRWSDLRERHTEDPVRLIQSYGALAYDLGRENAGEQDDVPRSRNRSGLKALADLLLPWR
jgi:hypothetical protein